MILGDQASVTTDSDNSAMSDSAPLVSVLMGVYNAAPTLVRTLDSILSQEGVELEFIAVDDGSTDGSGEILDRRAAQDARLKVVHQQNSGLTLALQRGSELARGRYIARQDAGGDVSRPGRLQAQCAALAADVGAVFATCGTNFVDVEGVSLYEEIPDAAKVAAGLSTLRLPGVHGIMHASAMFRTDAFRAVGGYRSAFAVAQDIDLWLRLHEVGHCAVAKGVFYDYRVEPGGISGKRHGEQMGYADLAIRCALERRRGQKEPALVISDQVLSTHGRAPGRTLADYHYFVASCLRRKDPRRARQHYLRAWRAQPSRLKALAGALITW